jgi:hypothetical protein
MATTEGEIPVTPREQIAAFRVQMAGRRSPEVAATFADNLAAWRVG